MFLAKVGEVVAVEVRYNNDWRKVIYEGVKSMEAGEFLIHLTDDSSELIVSINPRDIHTLTPIRKKVGEFNAYQPPPQTPLPEPSPEG